MSTRFDEPNARYQFALKLFQDDGFKDITFYVQGEGIRAHRCVLAASSEEFAKLLGGDKPIEGETIYDRLISKEGFTDFLKYVYTRCIDITHANMFHLGRLGTTYGFPELTAAAEKFIINSITVPNCVEKWDQAVIWELKAVEEKAIKTFKPKATDALREESALSIQEEIVFRIVCTGEMNIQEIDLFIFVDKYFRRNEMCNRRDEILAKIRYGAISMFDLTRRVKDSGMAPQELYLSGLEWHSRQDIDVPEFFGQIRAAKPEVQHSQPSAAASPVPSPMKTVASQTPQPVTPVESAPAPTPTPVRVDVDIPRHVEAPTTGGDLVRWENDQKSATIQEDYVANRGTIFQDGQIASWNVKIENVSNCCDIGVVSATHKGHFNIAKGVPSAWGIRNRGLIMPSKIADNKAKFENGQILRCFLDLADKKEFKVIFPSGHEVVIGGVVGPVHAAFCGDEGASAAIVD